MFGQTEVSFHVYFIILIYSLVFFFTTFSSCFAQLPVYLRKIIYSKRVCLKCVGTSSTRVIVFVHAVLQTEIHRLLFMRSAAFLSVFVLHLINIFVLSSNYYNKLDVFANPKKVPWESQFCGI